MFIDVFVFYVLSFFVIFFATAQISGFYAMIFSENESHDRFIDWSRVASNIDYEEEKKIAKARHECWKAGQEAAKELEEILFFEGVDCLSLELEFNALAHKYNSIKSTDYSRAFNVLDARYPI